ncbi:MAG TPA: type II toxin-antitoxin system RelE/ParE family toxin [Acidobacteriaceae bacterium]|nr:type II toxin-antitoxin system RelE/ParE family toxin [Acidobacteriaceae bacterium]
MIVNCKDRDTRVLWETGKSRRFPPSIRGMANYKLAILDAVTGLSELKVPPGNRLEALKGERKGQYSIRINDQYRICFVWKTDNAYDVEVVDYHS